MKYKMWTIRMLAAMLMMMCGFTLGGMSSHASTKSNMDKMVNNFCKAKYKKAKRELCFTSQQPPHCRIARKKRAAAAGLRRSGRTSVCSHLEGGLCLVQLGAQYLRRFRGNVLGKNDPLPISDEAVWSDPTACRSEKGRGAN